MNKIAYAAAALATVAALAACTSSRTTISTGGKASGSPAPTGIGTEVITASTAKLDATSATIKASGEFTDTGTLQLPIGNPRTITFKFAHGNLVVLNATGPTSGPLHLNKATCAFSQSLAGTYRILSGPSTGSYAGATGHGWYAFDTERVASKTSDDGCNTGGHATLAKPLFTISFRGPLVLNPRN